MQADHISFPACKQVFGELRKITDQGGVNGLFRLGLQVLSRLDRPEVATVPGIVFWLLEGEGIHRYSATFQLRVIPKVDKHTNGYYEEHFKSKHPH